MLGRVAPRLMVTCGIVDGLSVDGVFIMWFEGQGRCRRCLGSKGCRLRIYFVYGNVVLVAERDRWVRLFWHGLGLC